MHTEPITGGVTATFVPATDTASSGTDPGTARGSPDRTPSPRPTRRQWNDLLLEEYRSARLPPTGDAEEVLPPGRGSPEYHER